MEKEALFKVIKKAQKGDCSAQEALYKDSAKSVYYLALKILNNSDDAEDITQDVFITVLEKIAKFRQPEAYYKWLNRITANKCMDLLRKKNKSSVDEFSEEIMLEQPDENTSLIPEQYADDMETRHIILEIIEALPEPQKICVMYRYYSQLSVEEISEVIGVNEHTVRSRLALARKKIKSAILEKEEKDDIKLHAIPIMPILFKSFEEFSMPEGISENIWESVCSKLSAYGGGLAASSKAAGTAKGITAEAAKKAFAVKIAAISGAVLAAGGAVAAAVLIISSNSQSVLPAGGTQAVTQNSAGGTQVITQSGISDRGESEDSINNNDNEISSINEIQISGERDIAEALSHFYGTYRFDGDKNEIVIDENGVSYGGQYMSILRVTLDDYVKFNDSNAMFVMHSDMITANFMHESDVSYLDQYYLVGGKPASVQTETSDSAETNSETETSSFSGVFVHPQEASLTVNDGGSFVYAYNEASYTGTFPKTISESPFMITLTAEDGTELECKISYRPDYTAISTDFTDENGNHISHDLAKE